MAKKKVTKKVENKNLTFETSYEVDESFDDERFIKLSLRVLHDKKNPNFSNFSLDAIEKAKPTIFNIPILANVVVDEDGNVDFGSHDVKIEEDKMNEGEHKLIYSEIPIGLIPQTNNYRIEEFEGRNYVVVEGYVWKMYSGYAADIIESRDETKISMEILVDDYSLLAEDENYIDVKNYKYTGITCLGEKFGTGMLKAKAEKVEFSEDKNKENFVKMANELKMALEKSNEVVEGSEGVENKDNINVQLSENEGENTPNNSTEDNVVVEDNVDGTIEKPLENESKNFALTAKEKMEKLDNSLSGYSDKDGLHTSCYVMDYDDKYAYMSIHFYNEKENVSGHYYARCPYAIEDGNCFGDMLNSEVVYSTFVTKAERDKLESERNQVIADYEEKIKLSKSEIESKDKTIKELQSFKNKIELELKQSQIDEIIADFEPILKDNEEFNSIKEKAIEMEIKDLEKELYALEGKSKHISQNKKSKKQNFSRVAIVVDGDSGNDGINDEIVKRYGSASKYFRK